MLAQQSVRIIDPTIKLWILPSVDLNDQSDVAGIEVEMAVVYSELDALSEVEAVIAFRPVLTRHTGCDISE